MRKRSSAGIATVRFAVCLAMALFVGAECALARSVSLDLRNKAPAGAKMRLASVATSGTDGTLRSFNLDAGVADVGEVAVGDRLAFTLFDDVAIELTLKEKMPTPLGGDAFLAEASGYEGVKNAVVLRTADGLTVDVHDFRRNKIYKVVSTESGVAVKEVEAGGGACGCDTLTPPKRGAGPAKSASVAADPASGPVALRSEVGDVFVDILVAYDKNAAAWAKSNGGITNFALTAVQNMNAAIANTGLDRSFKFRLVGIETLSVYTDDLDKALDAATDGTGGWAPVKAKRDEVGADVVTVLIDTGSAYGTTGLGWSLENTDFAWFANIAYNVCAIRSVAQSHTMTHEVGHNMGCGHSDIQRSSPGPQLYDYSAGYYFTAGGDAYHTIMAYGTEGPGGDEAPYFSSPNHYFKGVAVGDATHNNTRTLAETFAAVSQWRTATGGEIGGGEDDPGSGSADAFSDARAVSGASGSAVFSNVGYTLESGEPLHSCDEYPGGASAWASWTAPATGDWTFWLTGSGELDTQLAIYTGSTLRSLTLVAANDDTPVGDDYSSRVSFRATKGVEYKIAMDTYDGEQGLLTLRWEEGIPAYAVFDHEAMFAPVSGCESSVDVSSSGEWSIVEHSDWITPHVSSGVGGMTELTFTVAANGTGYERSGFLTVRPNGSSDISTFTIRQNTVDFVTTRKEAEAAAGLGGKRILLVLGREGCLNTQSTLFYSIPSATVKPLLDDGYVIWYSNCDRQADAGQYVIDFSGSYTLPVVCIIDPLNISTYVARVTGYQSADDLKAFLEANPPAPVSGDTAKFDHEAMFAPVSGCESSVDVSSSGGWSLVEHPDWITPHVSAGGAGTTALSFTVAANGTGYERSGSLTVRPNGSSDISTFTIRQNTVDFVTTREEAAAAADLAGKRILLVMGRESCGNTIATLFYSIPSATVKPMLDDGYVIWYSNCDRQTDAYQYANGLGSYTLPLVCIIDPLNISTYAARVTGYQSADDLKAFFEANPPPVAPETYAVTYMPGAYGVGSQRTVSKTAGVALSLAGAIFSRAGYVQTGWAASDGGAKAYGLGASYTVDAAITLYPYWEEAGGAGEVPFSATGGDADWYVDVDGSWRSGKITDSQSSWAEVKVTGPSKVSFKWKTSSEGGYDLLRCYVDGVEAVSPVSGVMPDWSDVAIAVAESGMHTLRFEYRKDSSASNGEDCGWVRDIVAESATVRMLTLDANGGLVNGGATARMAVIDGCALGELPVPVWNGTGGRRFIGWFTDPVDGDAVAVGMPVSPELTSLYAHWKVFNPPANDNFAKATLIYGAIGSVAGTTIDSTRETQDMIPDYEDEYYTSTVWYKWTAPCDGNFTFSVNDADTERGRTGYVGITSGYSEERMEWEDSAIDWGSVSVNASKGDVYWIEVASYFDEEYEEESEEFDFTLSWVCMDSEAGFDYVYNGDGTVTILGCKDGLYDDDLVIPSEIGGMPVVTIGKAAFSGLGMTSVTIPPTVRMIGGSAFANCGNLAKVVFQGHCPGGAEYMFGGYIWSEDANVPEGCVVEIPRGSVGWTQYWDWGFWSLVFLGVDELYSPPDYWGVMKVVVSGDVLGDIAEIKGESGTAAYPQCDAGPASPSLWWRCDSDRSVYFRWTAPFSGPVKFDTFGTPFDTAVIVVASDDEGTWFVAENDDYGGGATSKVTFKAEAGATYWIAVGSPRHGTIDGDIVLNWGKPSGTANLTVQTESYDDETASGKASGGGTVPVGSTVTLKATADKGSVFAGWFDANGSMLEGDVDYRSTTFPYEVMDDGELSVFARFAKSAEDSEITFWFSRSYEAESDGSFGMVASYYVDSLSFPKLTVKGLPAGLKYDAKTGVIYGKATKPGVYTVTVGATNASVKKPVSTTFDIVVPNLSCDALPGLMPETDAYGTFWCGAAIDPEWIDCKPESGWSVKVSGLPAGLKYDAGTGRITGMPTKAGAYTVTFTASRGGEKQTATITLKVGTLPTWASGTFVGSARSLTWTGECDSESGDSGFATITVGASGKASGKVSVGGVNWTFSAAGYSYVEADQEWWYDDETGEEWAVDAVYAVELSGKFKAGKNEVDAVIRIESCEAPEDGGYKSVEADDGARLMNACAYSVSECGHSVGDKSFEFTLWRNMWKDKSTADEAKAELAKWEGVYTLSISPAGYLSLVVGKDGTVKASGKLGDGTGVSASATLVYDVWEADGYCAVVYTAPSAYKGGSFLLSVGFGRESGELFPAGNCRWTSRNPQATGEYGAGIDEWPEFVGAYYDKTDKLSAHYASLSVAIESPLLGYVYKLTTIEDGRKVVEQSQEQAEPVGTDCPAVGVVDSGFVVPAATKPVKVDGEWVYEGANDGALSLSFAQATGIFKGSYTFWYDYQSAYDETKDKETWAHTSKKASFEGIWVQGYDTLNGFFLWDATSSYSDPTTGKEKTYKYKETYPVELAP